MTENERKAIYIGGSVLLNIMKWLLFIYTIITLGFTLGLLVVAVINGNNLSPDLVVKFTDVMVPYKGDEIKLFIDNYGMNKVLIASIGYGVAHSLTTMLYYILMIKIVPFFKRITLGELYNKSAKTDLDEIISISFMATFAMPIMLFIISTTTNIFTDAYIKTGFGGLFILIFAFILKIVIERSSTMIKNTKRYDQLIDDYKADIDDLKIQSIKREAELKELKKVVNEYKAAKRAAKKEVVKKPATKKATSTAKKRTTKK